MFITGASIFSVPYLETPKQRAGSCKIFLKKIRIFPVVIQFFLWFAGSFSREKQHMKFHFCMDLCPNYVGNSIFLAFFAGFFLKRDCLSPPPV